MGTASTDCGTGAKANTLETHQTARDERVMEKYETLLGGHPDGIFEVDASGEILNANPASERITGYSIHLLTEMNISDVFNNVKWTTQSPSKETVSNCVTGEGSLTHKNGHSIYVQLKRIPIEVEDRVIGSHVIVRDRTDEKLTEHELKYAKEQIQTIFDTLDVALWSQVLPSKAVIQVSPGSEKIWGIPIQTILRDPSACYDTIHPDDVEHVREKMKTLEDGNQFIDDYRVIHPNGDIRWIHDRVIPILNSDGQLQRLIGLAVDITQQKLAEEERVRTRQMLERSEKLNVLGQLAAGIAHEIRNPLTSLMGFVQLVKSGTGDFQSYFEIMASELERINTIIGEFLVLSKPHSESLKIHDVNHIIETTVAFLRGETAMNNTSIAMNLSTLPPVFCDENQMKQVFINIVRNAMEAMPNGGTVTIDAEQAGEREISIRISDEGCGIPPEWISKIGEPFFTTKENGTGLGMMVTQQIVNSHGGRIQITSSVDKGTAVSIILPASTRAGSG